MPTPEPASELSRGEQEKLCDDIYRFAEETLPGVYESLEKDQVEALVDLVEPEKVQKLLEGESGYAEDEEIDDAEVYYVREDRELVATGFVTLKSETAEIHFFYVTEDHRGEGIGTALAEKAESWASEHGAEELKADIFSFNQDSMRFVESLGFEEWDEVNVNTFEGRKKIYKKPLREKIYADNT